MKKSMLFLAIPFLLLGLVSCNNQPEDSSKDSLSNITTAPSTNPTTAPTTSSTGNSLFEGEWSSELKALMLEVLNEEIPFVKLADNYQFTKAEDETDEYIYIYDETSTNIIDEYGEHLIDLGYSYDGSETDDYTAYFYTKGNLVIQLDYFPGSSDYLAGNEIYAWLEDDGGSTTDDPGQTTLTAWPEDLLTAMNSQFKTTIPFVALADNFEYLSDEDGISIMDATSENYLSNYGESLESAGYTKLLEDDSYGYDIYQYYKAYDEDYNVIVEYSFFPGNDYYEPGNAIYMYLKQIVKEVKVDAWPANEIASCINENWQLTVPSFLVAGQYTYYFYGTGIYVYGTVNEDISSAYQTTLVSNGFLEGYDAQQEMSYYYDWEENVSVYFSYDAEEKIFLILVQPIEPAYDQLFSNFPQDKIAEFLGDNAVEVPAFSIAEGETYKYTYQEEFEFFGYVFPATIEIDVKDAGTVGENSLEDTYKTLLEGKGWEIDESQYDENGIIATSSNVTLTFFTVNGVFSLYIEK